VNPYFRCREAREEMERRGIRVVVPAGAQAFANSPTSKKYIKLDHYKNQFSSIGYKALTESENLKNCEELEIYRD
jgi:hypothetical protein